ncbi:MAG TPA: sialidase family protein [Cyclobacteriaceae bacterium]|nr:sialidase family protein [Cyclobacteriaceae bacterium]
MKTAFVILFFSVQFATAQFKSSIICEGDMAINPTVSINKKDTKNLVIASAEAIYYSADEGKTWQRSPVELKGSAEHRLISERKGDLFDFYLSLNAERKRYDKIVCQSSRDGGATWQVMGAVTSPNKDVRDPRVSIYNKSGEFMLTWTQYDQYGSENPDHKSNIMHAQSKEGKKWSAALQVNQLSGDCRDQDQTVKGGMPGINAKEMMFVAWAMNQAFYIDRSFNKGTTWLSNDIHVADQPGGWLYQVPGSGRVEGLPEFSIDNSTGRFAGALYLSWADQRNGTDDTDIWFLRSVNYGDNWSTALRVNDDGKNKHQYMPAMAVDQSDGNIYVAFYDRRNYNDEQTDVYLAFSNDNGVSFKNVKISEEPFIPITGRNMGTYISIDAHQGVIVPVWTCIINGNVATRTAVIRRDDLIKPSAKEKP